MNIYTSISLGRPQTAAEVQINDTSDRSSTLRVQPSSFLIRTAMRISRARWFGFLRRVFHYQNGSRSSSLGSNPFNSSTWMVLEFFALVVQISIITLTLGVSRTEKPVWPMKVWIAGYNLGCALSMILLYWRYRCMFVHQYQGDALSHSDVEQQQSTAECRGSNTMNRCQTSLELFFAIWFVMGNVWVFDSRLGSFNQAPNLHMLCISLLAWNAISYSFPFLLFLLFCCCVPLVSSLLGYNMNNRSIDRGAFEDQISKLPSLRYQALEVSDCDSDLTYERPECCICLAKYKDKEEIRQLPCSHMFHLKCVDQWLRIISSCPLCKQDIDR